MTQPDYFSSDFLKKEFERKVQTCLTNHRPLNNYELIFVNDIRKLYESRQDATEFGYEPWQPTAKQLNRLADCYEKANRG